MPSPGFVAARALLSAADQSAIDSQLAAWKAESTPSDRPQIAKNIQNETAISPDDFAKLLSRFVAELPSHSDPIVAWTTACGIHVFSGNAVEPTDRPQKLGRACKFDTHLGRCGLTDAKLKSSITKYAGKTPISSLEKLLRKQNLGGSVIFATFNDTDSKGDPFGGLPRDRDAIRTALGLGFPNHGSPDPYLLFIYTSDEPPALPLHRPTVADAGDSSYFRPGKTEVEKWGSTLPLKPNPRKLPPRPELVHKQITGTRLVFPYEITSP